MKFPKLLFDKEKLIEYGITNAKKPRAELHFPKIFFDHENFEAYEKIFSNVVIVDAHTHIGRDKDGHGIDGQAFIRQMKMAHINKSIVFPLNEPLSRNFTKSNESVYRFGRKYPDRIIPFFRLNPKSRWKKEYEKRVMQGFMGIKLHPRSQDFGIASSYAMKIYGRAEKSKLPVLIHAGFGLDNIADDIKKVIGNFPKLRLILGHSAFVDFEKTIKNTANSPNVLFDTSTLRIFDLLRLINSVNYGRIVFGSDVPYYDFDIALEMLVDTAIICNKKPNEIKAILGSNILRWFK
ncbi:amidohydrolase family protein [Candidatus Woesearchaeota archaeon]|nr:amidohydrolase family protein [Candidatus Woesearchaeota archaeon]